MRSPGHGRTSPAKEALVIAAVQAGAQAADAAKAAGVCERTARTIIAECRQLSPELIPDQDHTIAILAGDIMVNMLEYMARQPPEVQWKHGAPLNFIRGTVQDKMMRRSPPANSNVNIYVSFDQPPDIIPHYKNAETET